MIWHFTAYTIDCVHRSIRSMFRVLGMYNFDLIFFTGLDQNFFGEADGSRNINSLEFQTQKFPIIILSAKQFNNLTFLTYIYISISICALIFK